MHTYYMHAGIFRNAELSARSVALSLPDTQPPLELRENVFEHLKDLIEEGRKYY